MAIFRKAGNMLGRTLSSHINQEITSSRPSIFQAIRCMSTSKLFIGGLSYGTDDMSLAEAFSKYGDVAEARVIVDRDTGRSRGFGFVTYASIDDASAAIQALDQQELHGRRIRVNYANDRARGSDGGGYRGGGYGGGNYGSGGGYNNNDGYGGNYGSGGGYNNNDGYGGNYGGGNYGRGGAGYGGGDAAGVGKYDGGNMSYGGDGQNFGVTGGTGGNSDAGSQFASSGQEGFGDTFGTKQSNQFGGDGEVLGLDDPSEGNYRDDDDTPGNYADRRG